MSTASRVAWEGLIGDLQAEGWQLETGSDGDWSWHELPYPHAGYLAPVEAVRMLRQLHVLWLTR